MIKIAPDDPLVAVYGSYGTWFGANYILQLTFVTRNGKAFGPYGDMSYAQEISPFILSAGDGKHIAGFCGASTPADNGNMMLLGALGIITADD